MARSTGDLLVLMLAGTVCTVLVILAVLVVVVEFTKPNTQTDHIVAALGSILSTLVGIVGGYLAGRTTRRYRRED